MKINFMIKKKIQNFLFLLFSLFVFLFQSNYHILNALPMDKYQSELVTEELRLIVPADLKDAWLKAEKTVWEPWLSNQDGFLGREIYWDKEKEEALILVKWRNKKLWKNIPMGEVNKVQEKFEKNIEASLNVKENPFKLIYEGEIYKQG